MSFTYTNSSSSISFEYWDSIPSKKMAKGRINLAALSLYGFYRKSVYESYKEKPDLAPDIKIRKKEFIEKDNPVLNGGLYNDPLYHYSIAACLGAMQEWKDPNKKIHSYMAFDNANGVKRRIGFVHFNEKVIDNKPVIYIAQAGVQCRGKGIGKHLMECVLAHYPAGTEFYIVTRVFNSDAKNLYDKRLGFTPIKEEEINQLGYDTRYCGFKHTTVQEEVDSIKQRQRDFAMSSAADSLQTSTATSLKM